MIEFQDRTATQKTDNSFEKRTTMIEFHYGEKRPKAVYPPHPKFGTLFAPHYLRISIDPEKSGPLEASIGPFNREPMSAANLTLHYGQSIFEGMKAFRQPNGDVAIFRPELHARRFAHSAQRMAMPMLSEQDFMACLEEYVRFEKDSVPSEEDHSLYLRPLMIAADDQVKVGRSKKYTFYLMSCIVGGYFGGDAVRSARVLVNRTFVRACPGGLGEAKTAANYAASIYPQACAEKLGCDQVLYLDAVHHESIDELGGMNFFVIHKNELLTPELNGAILNGVTRRSLLELAPSLGLKPVERRLTMSEVIAGVRSGDIRAAFACGTAAVIQPIGELVLQEREGGPTETLKIPGPFDKCLELRSELVNLQRGRAADPHGWRHLV